MNNVCKFVNFLILNYISLIKVIIIYVFIKLYEIEIFLFLNVVSGYVFNSLMMELF